MVGNEGAKALADVSSRTLIDDVSTFFDLFVYTVICVDSRLQLTEMADFIVLYAGNSKQQCAQTALIEE